MFLQIETADEKACWREGAILSAVISAVLLVLSLMLSTGIGFVVIALLLILWALLTYFFATQCLSRKGVKADAAAIGKTVAAPSQAAGPGTASEPISEPAAAPKADPAPEPAVAPGPAAVTAAPEETAAAAAPALLAAPRGGQPDDLKRLKGVGPKLEGLLHEMGIYHFDQIAGWTEAEIAWVDDRLSFKGRITRDGWIDQAKALAAEKEG